VEGRPARKVAALFLVPSASRSSVGLTDLAVRCKAARRRNAACGPCRPQASQHALSRKPPRWTRRSLRAGLSAASPSWGRRPLSHQEADQHDEHGREAFATGLHAGAPPVHRSTEIICVGSLGACPMPRRRGPSSKPSQGSWSMPNTATVQRDSQTPLALGPETNIKPQRATAHGLTPTPRRLPRAG